jgi:hypothetical protein
VPEWVEAMSVNGRGPKAVSVWGRSL